METGYGLVERAGVVSAQLALETAEGAAGRREKLRRLRILQAHGALNEGVAAPDAALAVSVIQLPGGGLEHGQRLPRGVAALGREPLAEICGHAGYVGHDLLGVLERGGAKALEYEPAARVLARLGVDAEGVVDVPVAVAHRADELAAEVPGGQSLAQILFRFRHAHTSQRLSGYSPDAVMSAIAPSTTGLSSR